MRHREITHSDTGEAALFEMPVTTSPAIRELGAGASAACPVESRFARCYVPLACTEGRGREPT
jgi:hypothetical protein